MESGSWSDDDEKYAEMWTSIHRKNHPEIEAQIKFEQESKDRSTKQRKEAILIELEWQLKIGTSFPGWSEAALAAMTELAGLHDTDQFTKFDIYRRAIKVLAGPTGGKTVGTGKSTGKAATCNQLMLAIMQSNPDECVGWSAYEWSQRVAKSESTVKETKAWGMLQGMRTNEILNRAKPKDRHRRPKKH